MELKDISRDENNSNMISTKGSWKYMYHEVRIEWNKQVLRLWKMDKKETLHLITFRTESLMVWKWNSWAT